MKDIPLMDISFMDKPAKIVRSETETQLQARCVRWYRDRPYTEGKGTAWARKFSSMSQRSVPDYLFGRTHWMLDNGIKFFCEFKRPGHKRDKFTKLMSTTAQIEEQQLMRDAGWFGFECDDFEVFKATVLSYEQRCINGNND